MKRFALKAGLVLVTVNCLAALSPLARPVAVAQEKIDKAEAMKKELAALQGTWRLLHWEEDGRVISFDKDKAVCVVTGTKVKNDDLEGILVLVDVSQNPAQLNVQFPERKLDEFIYVRVGDYMIMCGQRGGHRPTEFKTSPRDEGEINQLFIWKIER
jgi:uncharacterized protein (TIGR03067 family)